MGLPLVAILFLGMASLASARSLEPQDLSFQGLNTRESQLQEFSQVFKPEYDSYLAFGWLYFPKSDQVRLSSPYGVHDGFAFRHRFSLFLQNNVDTNSTLRTGLGWWWERQGWETEDFLVVPERSSFGLVRSVHTFALSLSDTKRKLGLAAGLQWQNPEGTHGIVHSQETDSLWWFGHLLWDRYVAQMQWQGLEFSMLRVQAGLADRELRGGTITGFKTYLPDLEGLWLPGEEDAIRLQWLQNLWKQRIYLQATAWPMMGHEGSASLLFYTDPSHLLGAEVAVRRSVEGDWVFGGGIEVPFLRVSVNVPREYEQFFANRGTQILLEFQMNIGAIQNRALFRRNAPRSAPMETEKVKHTPFESVADSSNGRAP